MTAMMGEEEAFILKSPERRRILIDLYETNLSDSLSEKMAGQLYFSTDMEEAKTWLVSD